MSEMSQKEEYLYIIKNHDIQKLINNSGLPESDKNVIKEKLLSNDVDLSEKLKILNYILKYQKSEYYRGQVILDTDENELYKINEPGYYSVEIIGANGGAVGINKSGLAKDGTVKNVILNGSVFINENYQDSRFLYFTTDFKWYYFETDLSKATYGKFELNEKAIFLHKEGEFNYTEKVSLSNYRTLNVDNIKRVNELIIQEKFYDFSYLIVDPLEIDDSNYKKLSFEFGIFKIYEPNVDEQNSVYSKVSVMKGFGVPDYENDFDNLDIFNYKKYNEYITNFIKETSSGVDAYEEYDISSQKTTRPDQCFEINFARNIVENVNKSPAGSGGYFNKVFKINKSVLLSYNIGKSGSSSINDPKAGSETNITFKNESKEVLFTAYAQGGKSTKDGVTPILDNNSTHNDDIFSQDTWKDSINRDDFTINSNKISYSVGGVKNLDGLSSLDRFAGKTGYEKYKINNDLEIIDDKVVFYGGGNKGQGVQLNDFENAYYEHPQSGRIVIKYLGPLSSEKFNIKVNTKDSIMSSVVEEFSPAQSRIKLVFKMPKTNQFLDFNKSTVVFGDDTISFKEFLTDKDSEISIFKDVNYYTLEFTVTKNTIFNLEKIEDIRYCTTINDDQQILSISSNDSDYLSLCGSSSESQDLTLIFKDLDISIDSAINSAYNYTSFFENVYSSLDRRSNINIKSKYNFALIKKVKKAYELNLKKGNELDLEPKYDINSFVILKGKLCKIDKISYSYDLKTFLPLEKSLTLFENQKVYFKIEFNSSRVRISKILSGLDSSFVIHKLNYDIINDAFLEKDDDYGVQYITYTQTNFSQTKILNIEANTFTVSLKPDLYETIDFKTIDNKESYEYGEEIILSSNLNKNLYFSLRDIAAFDKEKYNIIPNEKEKYESSILVGQSKNTIRFGYNFQYEDKKDTFKEKLNGFINSDRVFKLENDKKCDGVFFCLKETERKFANCLVILRFKMPENDISIRLTSDFNYNSRILAPTNLQEESFVFGKNIALRYIGSGGNSGNGGAGGNGTPQQEESSSGGGGGSGFYGGGAGSGGDTAHWQIGIDSKLSVEWDRGIKLKCWFGFVIVCYISGMRGLPGEGFYAGGTIGGEGHGGLEYGSQATHAIEPTASKSPGSPGRSFSASDKSTYSLSKYRGRFIDAIIYANKIDKVTVQSITSYCGDRGFDGNDGIGSGGDDKYMTVTPDSNWAPPHLVYIAGDGATSSYEARVRCGLRPIDGKSGAGGTAGVPSFITSTNARLSFISINKKSMIDLTSDVVFNNLILGGGVDGHSSKVLLAATNRHQDLGNAQRAEASGTCYIITHNAGDRKWGPRSHDMNFYYQYIKTEQYSSINMMYTPYLLFELVDGKKYQSDRNRAADYDLKFTTGSNKGKTHVKKFGCGSYAMEGTTYEQRYKNFLANTKGQTLVNSRLKDILSVKNVVSIVIPPDITENIAYIDKPINFGNTDLFYDSLKKGLSTNQLSESYKTITDPSTLTDIAGKFRDIDVSTTLGHIPNTACASEIIALGEFCLYTNKEKYSNAYKDFELIELASAKSGLYYSRNWFFTSSSKYYQ